MKIHILKVPDELQPREQPFRYPAGNNDYGVEQEFWDWLALHPEYVTENPTDADFHYLPVFWTRYHLNHNYGKDGQAGLQLSVSAAIRDETKTFTVCQYDDGPQVNIGRAIQFLSSRKTAEDIDIPLLRNAHRRPFPSPSKKYLASFLGRLATHSMRQEMADAVANRPDILIADSDRRNKYFNRYLGTWSFVRMTVASYVGLAPRGYGGSSFRAFEAMQLGVAPFVIGDLDTRPFRKFIDWDSFGFYTDDPKQIPAMLATRTPAQLLAMGQRARHVYDTQFANLRWCPYILEELKQRK